MGYQQLIPEYIEQDPTLPGPDDVRLKEYGVPVWALAGYWLQARQTMD